MLPTSSIRISGGVDPALTALEHDEDVWTGEIPWRDAHGPADAHLTLTADGAHPWPELPAKSLRTAYALALGGGLLGAHRAYLGKWVSAGLYSVSLGGLGIGVLVDLVTLPMQVRELNSLRSLGIR